MKPPATFEVFSVGEIDGWRDAIDRMYRRDVDGIVIRGVLSDATMRDVVARLDAGTPPLRRRIVEHADDGTPPPYVVSRGIVTSPPDLRDYFDDAAHFADGCRALFSGHEDFEARLGGLVARIGGGRRVEVPRGPAGQRYSPATIRVLPPLREIALHSGNDFLHRPECAHLRGLVDNETQLSFFIPLELPSCGGELELYGVRWEETDGQRQVHGVPVALWVALSSRMTAPVGRGDLLVFDGGRIYHKVTPVGAGERRVTIGGFIGLSVDHDILYHWS